MIISQKVAAAVVVAAVVEVEVGDAAAAFQGEDNSCFHPHSSGVGAALAFDQNRTCRYPNTSRKIVRTIVVYPKSM